MDAQITESAALPRLLASCVPVLHANRFTIRSCAPTHPNESRLPTRSAKCRSSMSGLQRNQVRDANSRAHRQIALCSCVTDHGLLTCEMLRQRVTSGRVEIGLYAPHTISNATTPISETGAGPSRHPSPHMISLSNPPERRALAQLLRRLPPSMSGYANRLVRSAATSLSVTRPGPSCQ